jgi:polynucleotide 5'-hydroxyl-kinase GRC3/NOL9
LRYLVNSSNTVIVKGPASVALLSGYATVLGATLKNELIISSEKQLPIEAKSDSEFEILLGKYGQVKEIKYSSLPKSWASAADTLTLMEEGSVIIVGPSDVGKSTLCTYLMNELLNRTFRPVIIDADIGQADIGPPTIVASATPNAPVPSLTGLEPDRMMFIGHTNPSAAEPRIINGIKRLMTCHNGPITIINTDGWTVDFDALSYKSRMISTIKPDIVIGIGSKTELQPIMNATQAEWIFVEPSHALLPRSRNARREHRTYGYRRFLEGGTIHTISLKLLKLNPVIHHFRASDLHNLITGLLDERGYLLHIGVLTKLEESSLRVFARSVLGVTSIELGYVKISMDGSELGYLG